LRRTTVYLHKPPPWRHALIGQGTATTAETEIGIRDPIVIEETIVETDSTIGGTGQIETHTVAAVHAPHPHIVAALENDIQIAMMTATVVEMTTAIVSERGTGISETETTVSATVSATVIATATGVEGLPPQLLPPKIRSAA
jgi:hypothetical protein